MRPDWLVHIPPSWSSVPFGSIFTQSKKKNSLLQRDFVLSVIKDRGVIPYTEKGNVGNKVSDDLSGYKLVDKGDFVLNSMNLYMGSVGVSDYDGVTSTAYIVCKPRKDVYPGYYNYLIQFKGFQEYVGLLGKGIMEIREAVRWTALKSVFVPFPDLATQRQIAGFLDRETARIDLLIEKKQRLVALLEEKNDSEIWQSICCGADLDSAEAADHPWPTKLPEGWKLQKISQFASVGNGSTPRRENPAFWADEGTPWLNSGAIHQKWVKSSPYFVTDLALANCHLPIVEPNTVLVAITGQGKTRGTAALCKIRATISQHLAYVRIRNPAEIQPSFLLLALRAAYNYLRDQSAGVGSTRAALTCEYLKSLKIPIPPSSTQRVLVENIERAGRLSSASSEKTQESIDRLKEYRSALITAAVTGQIDVQTYGKSGTVDRRLDAIQEEMEA